MNVEVPLKVINPLQLKAELDAASGGKYQGFSTGAKWPGLVRLHFADDTLQAAIDASTLAYAQHNAGIKTASQQAEERQLQAAADIALEDFANVKDAINALSVADPVKQILRRMNRNTARLALAVRASIGTDPGT